MYDRILVAIDATPSDDNVTLQRAETFAQRWGSIVHLLHVARGHVVPGDITGGVDTGLARLQILVDEHAIELVADAVAGALAQQLAPEQEEVVVVEHSELLLAIDVTAEEFLQAIDVLEAPGESRFQDLLQRLLRVDAAAVDVDTGRFEREPGLAFAHAQFGAEDLHQVFGVTAVEDRELAGEADRLPVLP